MLMQVSCSFQRAPSNASESSKRSPKIAHVRSFLLLSSQGQSTSADGTIVTLQEQLAEKERQIKRIKEQRDRAEKEKGEEAALMQKSSTEQIAKAEDLRRQLDEKTSELTDLRWVEACASQAIGIGIKL